MIQALKNDFKNDLCDTNILIIKIIIIIIIIIIMIIKCQYTVGLGIY